MYNIKMDYSKLKNLNINLSNNKINILENYIKLFLEYNEKVNLISKNDTKFLFEKHIYDSLSLNLFLQKYKLNGNYKVLDIGTGGGFPSLPLSIFFDNLKITAIDSIAKKINFIKTASSELDIKNVFPLCKRVEELDNSDKNSYDIVVSRAMSELKFLLEYAIPFLKVGGYFIAYKSLKAEEELKNAQNALLKLNSVLIDTIEYSLPTDEQNKRVLLIIQKKKEISNIYPRKNGLITKKPI